MSKRKAPKPKKSLFARRPFLYALIVGLLVIVAIASFYAFGSDDAPKRSIRQEPVVSEEAEVRVDVVDRDYEPRDLTINKGARVTWKFKGDLPHNVVDDRGAFESPILEQGDEWSLTFDDPGTFYYYCTLHHSMQGTLVVKE